MRFITTLAAAAFVLSQAACSPEHEFTATSYKGDQVRVIQTSDGVRLDVVSPTGIGKLDLSKEPAGHWPKGMVIQLHLKGLESLRIRHDNLLLNASLSSTESPSPVRQWLNENESETIDSSHPCWLKIQRIKTDTGESVIEVRLPAEVFNDQSKSITVNWIDFYR